MITLANEFSRAIEKMKETPQRKDYHPEVWVWRHEAYVYYGILNSEAELSEQQRKELLWTALFHDLGKVDKTFYREKKETYVSYGHEKAALPYYEAVKEALIGDNLRQDVIRFLIIQHMKPKMMDRMNESTIEQLKEDADDLGDDVWDLLMEFNSHDNMRNFKKNTEKNERYEARWLFHNFCSDAVEKINTYYETNENKVDDLFLLRGASGSGKSTIAKILEAEGAYTASADEFFVGDDGKYRYDGSKITEAHNSCKRRTEAALQANRDIVAVHNTFIEDWQMIHYFYLAAKYSYNVHTLIVENRHESDTIHNVPDTKIKEQREKFEMKL